MDSTTCQSTRMLHSQSLSYADVHKLLTTLVAEKSLFPIVDSTIFNSSMEQLGQAGIKREA